LNTFRFAITFCGYLPTTHLGLMGRINAATPMTTPHLLYFGNNDAIISPSMTRDAAAKFSHASKR
jgi:hypothetical protein